MLRRPCRLLRLAPALLRHYPRQKCGRTLHRPKRVVGGNTASLRRQGCRISSFVLAKRRRSVVASFVLYVLRGHFASFTSFAWSLWFALQGCFYHVIWRLFTQVASLRHNEDKSTPDPVADKLLLKKPSKPVLLDVREGLATFPVLDMVSKALRNHSRTEAGR